MRSRRQKRVFATSLDGKRGHLSFLGKESKGERGRDFEIMKYERSI